MNFPVYFEITPPYIRVKIFAKFTYKSDMMS